MRKHLKDLLLITLMFIITITLVGCERNNGKSWPTDIDYVPNIPYTGIGNIVDIKEDTSLGKQYMIYIKGATLESANEYIDKLYNNEWKILNMFTDDDKYLKQPEKDNFYKLGFENKDNTINAIITLHGGRNDYNLVITFANMEG